MQEKAANVDIVTLKPGFVKITKCVIYIPAKSEAADTIFAGSPVHLAGKGNRLEWQEPDNFLYRRNPWLVEIRSRQGTESGVMAPFSF